MTNIEKLARLIVRTGCADQIMAALALGIATGAIINPAKEAQSA